MSVRRLCLCAALVWAAALFDGVGAALVAAQNGAYTSQQADRGREEYTIACAHCHSSDLLGDLRLEIPSLAEDDFFVRWTGRTVASLFDMISRDMPADKPGRLERRVYEDILAYILQVNRFPAGAQELRGNPDVLGRILIEKP